MGSISNAVDATSRFSLDRLRVSPDLVGAKHEFIFDGCRATVALPTIEMEERGVETALMCIKWKSEGMVPLEYQVGVVDLTIELTEPIDIPEEMLGLPMKQVDLLNKAQIAKLDDLADKGSDTLQRAFDYWLRVVRWKSRIGYIGEPRIRYAGREGIGSVLKDRATRHRLWQSPQVIHAIGGKVATSNEWNEAQLALAANKQPPVWFEFLFEAQMRMNNEDLVGSVLTLAIAFEVSLRKIFSAGLERLDADPAILAVLDVANLRALLTRLKKVRAWNDDWAAATEFGALHKLMDYRDGVMHMAKVAELNRAELRTMYAAVEKFAYFSAGVLKLD
jgi:hypothetical protein